MESRSGLIAKVKHTSYATFTNVCAYALLLRRLQLRRTERKARNIISLVDEASLINLLLD